MIEDQDTQLNQVDPQQTNPVKYVEDGLGPTVPAGGNRRRECLERACIDTGLVESRPVDTEAASSHQNPLVGDPGHKVLWFWFRLGRNFLGPNTKTVYVQDPRRFLNVGRLDGTL